MEDPFCNSGDVYIQYFLYVYINIDRSCYINYNHFCIYSSRSCNSDYATARYQESFMEVMNDIEDLREYNEM